MRGNCMTGWCIMSPPARYSWTSFGAGSVSVNDGQRKPILNVATNTPIWPSLPVKSSSSVITQASVTWTTRTFSLKTQPSALLAEFRSRLTRSAHTFKSCGSTCWNGWILPRCKRFTPYRLMPNQRHGGDIQPPQCTGVKIRVRAGAPRRDRISTSFVERANLSVRHFTKRFVRLGLVTQTGKSPARRQFVHYGV